MKQWVCRVCHYMHTSEEPPGACLVCKAAAEAFDVIDDGVTEPEIRVPLNVMATSEQTLWRCQVCGAEHLGPLPPGVCPKCGVSPELWDEVASTRPCLDTDPNQEGGMTCAVCASPLGPEPRATCQLCGARSAWLSPAPLKAGANQPPRSMPSPRTFVIVGSGIAALRAAETVRANDASAHVSMLTREPCLPYDRRSLTRYLDGNVEAASIMLHSPDWYAAHGIDVHLEADVVSIQPRERVVRTHSRELSYDRLVLATGARVAVPFIPNVWLQGVHPLRSMLDCARILGLAGVGRRVTILGGGVLGLETAAAMRRRGCDVTVCERDEHVMRQQLDVTAARLLQRHMEGLGIRFIVGSEAEALEGDEGVRGVHLPDGAFEPTDLVLVTTGIVPNVNLAQSAGLATGQGIIVDDALQTSDPSIYAAGDCAEHRGLTYGSWPFAAAMGAIAGVNASGGAETFVPPLHVSILKVVDVDLCSIGRTAAQLPSDRELVHTENAGANYQKVLLDGSGLAGAVLLGDTHAISAIAEAMRAELDVSSMIDSTGTLKEFLSLLAKST